MALKCPEPRLGVLKIEPYAPGSNTARRGATVFKLSSNDAPLGPSPKAMCAYHEAAEHLAVYPDRPCAALRVECANGDWRFVYDAGLQGYAGLKVECITTNLGETVSEFYRFAGRVYQAAEAALAAFVRQGGGA